MEISLIHSKDINKDEWNRFIDNSSQGNLYGQYWYLDMVGKNWWAYFFKSEGKLVAVMPFFVKRKYFVNIIYQPLLCQQLGIYSIPNSPDLSEIIQSVINSWLKRYLIINYSFNLHNNSLVKNSISPDLLKDYITHLLPLYKDYSSAYNDFSKNHKRNIKKASKNELVVKLERDSISAVLDIFRSEKQNELGDIMTNSCALINEIFHFTKSDDTGNFYTVHNSSGTVLGGAFFIFYKNEVVYLFGTISQEGKQSGAMAFIFDHFIKTYSNSAHTLDFEGSQIPSIARFFKGFGAKEKSFYSISVNRLFFLEPLKKIIKNVRFS